MASLHVVCQALRSIVPNLNELGDGDVSLNETDTQLWRVELVYRELLVMRKASRELEDGEREVLRLLSEARSKLKHFVDCCELTPSQALVAQEGHVGQLGVCITPTRLSLCFSGNNI